MSVIQTQSRNRSVGDPTPAFESMKPMWDKARAVCGGEKAVKEFDGTVDTVAFENLLIPFSPTMSQAQYNFYKAEAELPGITSAFAKMLVGGLLRKPPEIRFRKEVPEDAETWIRDNFGADDSPILSFLAASLWEEVQTSRAWVGLNIASNNDEDAPIEPFPFWLRSDVVINHRVAEDPITGKNKLMFVIVRGYTEVYKEDEFHPTLTETVWVHELVNGKYQIREFHANKDASATVASGKIKMDPEKMPSQFKLEKTHKGIMIRGEVIDFIPLWPLNGEYDFGEPMLTSIIDKEVSLYNKISRRNHLLYGAATYTPIIFSDMMDEEFEKIVESGLGTWLHLGKDDKADILKTPTEALSDMEAAIEKSIEELAKLGVRMLSPETAQSGVALQLRNAAQTAQLGSLCTKLSATVRQIIAQMINWRYDLELKDGDVVFNLSSDFDTVGLGADWLRLITEWYQDGLIPRSIWLSIIKKNDIAPSDYDDEKGVEEINSDPVPARGRVEGADLMR